MDRVWDGQEPAVVFCAGGAAALVLGILGLGLGKMVEFARKVLTRCSKLRVTSLQDLSAVDPAWENLTGHLETLKEEGRQLGLKVQMMEQARDSLRTVVVNLAKSSEEHLKGVSAALLEIKEEGKQQKEQLKQLASLLGAAKDEGKLQREHLRKMAEGQRSSLEALAGTANETRDAMFNTIMKVDSLAALEEPVKLAECRSAKLGTEQGKILAEIAKIQPEFVKLANTLNKQKEVLQAVSEKVTGHQGPPAVAKPLETPPPAAAPPAPAKPLPGPAGKTPAPPPMPTKPPGTVPKPANIPTPKPLQLAEHLDGPKAGEQEELVAVVQAVLAARAAQSKPQA